MMALSPGNARKVGNSTTKKIVLGARHSTIRLHQAAVSGAIPAKGDRFFWRGWVFTVSEASPRQVTRVRAARAARPPAEPKGS